MKQEHEQLLREALQSARTVMATWAGDWSEDKRLAWLYGIICGWNYTALDDLSKQYDWSEQDVERLQRYHHLIQWLAREKEECVFCGKLRRIHQQVQVSVSYTRGSTLEEGQAWVNFCDSCYRIYAQGFPTRFGELTQ